MSVRELKSIIDFRVTVCSFEDVRFYFLLYSSIFFCVLIFSSTFLYFFLYSCIFYYILLFSSVFLYFLLYSCIFFSILLYSSLLFYILHFLPIEFYTVIGVRELKSISDFRVKPFTLRKILNTEIITSIYPPKYNIICSLRI